MHKVFIVTGSRADYSLLYPVIKRFSHDSDIELSVLSTGTHHRNSVSLQSILEKDDIHAARHVDSGFVDGSEHSVCHALSNTVNGFADFFQTQRADVLLLLGDRFEIFAAAQAAWIYQIPIAHIAGGDVTAGALDEAFRHSISKMSSLHFATHEQARQRILQLGEPPQSAHSVGSPGIDNLLAVQPMSKQELARELSFELSEQLYLVTLHPETVSRLSAQDQVNIVIQVLRLLPNDVSLVISAANSDPGGEQINSALQAFSSERPNTLFVNNLGRTGYVSLLARADMMLGNSSSGIYEAASFHLPVLNIGNRQQGRQQSTNVVNCDYDTGDIRQGIERALQLNCADCVNLYGDGHSAERIWKITKDFLNAPSQKGYSKQFHSYALGEQR